MTEKQTSLYAWLGILLVLWSSNFIFVKFALREIPPTMVIAMRYVVAGACMLPVILLGRRDPKWHEAVATWKDAPGLLGVGLLGLVGNQVLFVIGISRTSVAHAAMITALTPVLVLSWSTARGIERVTWVRVAGLLTAASGVILLQFSRGGTGGATTAGDAVMLISVLVFASFNVLGKPVAERFGSMKMNAFAYCAAGVLAIPVVAVEWNQSGSAGALAWIGVVYMGVCSSVLGYLIYAYALRHLPASRVSVVVYLQPLLASLLAVVLLGERPGSAFLPAAVLVLGGVYTVERLAA